MDLKGPREREAAWEGPSQRWFAECFTLAVVGPWMQATCAVLVSLPQVRPAGCARQCR
jgi:hypothetical protein